MRITSADRATSFTPEIGISPDVVHRLVSYVGVTAQEGDGPREETQVPLFMDVHTIEGGVSATDVAGAHKKDLETQGKHGVSYLRYWVDEEAGKIFCLVEAKSAEHAHTVHREAHGLVADEIFQVSEHS
jgi:hypothetical protein